MSDKKRRPKKPTRVRMVMLPESLFATETATDLGADLRVNVSLMLMPVYVAVKSKPTPSGQPKRTQKSKRGGK